MFLRWRQFLNAEPPKYLRSAFIVAVVRPLDSNAQLPIVVVFSGIIIEAKFQHEANALLPMVFNFSGSVMEDNFLQHQKAQFPIVSRVEGSFISRSDSQ